MLTGCNFEVVDLAILVICWMLVVIAYQALSGGKMFRELLLLTTQVDIIAVSLQSRTTIYLEKESTVHIYSST